MMKHNRGIWSIFFTTFKSFICEKPKAWAVMTILSLLTALGTPIKVYLEKVIFNAAETVALEKIISTELVKVFLVAVGVQLLYVVIYPQFRCHGNYFGSEFETILQRRLNKKTAKLDLEVYEDSSLYSDISAASSASRELRFMVMMFSSEILVYAFQFLMVSYILSSFHIALVILSFLAVLPDVLAKYMKSKWQYKVFDQSQPIFVRKNYYENLLLSPDSVKELRVSGAQNLLKEVWGKEKSLYNEEKWKVQKKAFLLDLFIQLCNVISVFCTYTIFIYLTMNGSISLGEFGASLGAVSTLKTNFSRICDLAMFSFECGLKGKNYYRVLDYSEEQKGKNSEISLDSGIKLDNVCFTYPKGTRVIRNISLKIKPGEKIAIVGKNGSGKSTLSKLILGLYHPNSGQVFYGNSDINIINKNIVYDKCSAVFQDFCRYFLSVQDNISISSTKETLDADRIKRLCEHIKIGGIDSDNIPNQKLGKEFGGSELSGGGWQKLAIIRGLYRQHELIVFDEPTAALDPLVESEIISDMLNIDQASIKIYVTHRLNSVKYADKVVVLQDGEIVGFGPHSELIEQNEVYRELWESQAHWYV